MIMLCQLAGMVSLVYTEGFVHMTWAGMENRSSEEAKKKKEHHQILQH